MNIDTILDRLSESSTWRGLIVIAGVLGWQFSPAHNEAIIATALSIVGLINVFRKS